MKEITVFRVDIYTSKKTGNQSLKVTGLCEDGVVVFFAPLSDQSKKGDKYVVTLEYSSFKMGYVAKYEKA